jgi:LPLT family lysophospholipid transporter-like MFS transporter
MAYCVVGMGAAIYSPAKYGILPELAGHEFLVKANSWIEGSAILAILLGMLVGAKVADFSTQWALTGTIILFMTSAVVTLFLPARVCIPEITSGSKVIVIAMLSLGALVFIATFLVSLHLPDNQVKQV